jgi:hypothetical protein
MSIDLTQKFVYETDSVDSLEKVLNVLTSIVFDEQPSKYNQMYITTDDTYFDDGRVWEHKEMSPGDPRGWSKPKYLQVCSLGDDRQAIKSKEETFDNYALLVQRAMQLVKDAPESKFWETCGNGFNQHFNSCDGDTGRGYRISLRKSGARDYIDISLCHIYYGK